MRDPARRLREFQRRVWFANSRYAIRFGIAGEEANGVSAPACSSRRMFSSDESRSAGDENDHGAVTSASVSSSRTSCTKGLMVGGLEIEPTACRLEQFGQAP